MPYRVMYTTNVDKDLLKRINQLSDKIKVRPNVILEQAINEYLEKHELIVPSDSSKQIIQ
jgi:predicted transcriptional regulator